jgi:hypothetical protein
LRPDRADGDTDLGPVIARPARGHGLIEPHFIVDEVRAGFLDRLTVDPQISPFTMKA